MGSNIFGAVLAFVIGVGIAGINYSISRYVLKKRPAQYAATMTLRQLIQVIYIVLVFLLGQYTPWDRLWLLVGGALGVTLPMSCLP